MNRNLWSGIALGCLVLGLTISGMAGVSAQDSSAKPQPTLADLANLPLLMPNSGDGDFRIAPPYSDAPELKPRDDVPKGMVYHFTMNSTDSKIYPGIAKSNPGAVVP